MAERGKHKYAVISTPSNQVVSTVPGSLYGVIFGANSGGTVRIDDTQRFAQGTVSASSTGSNTVGLFTATVNGLSIGLNTGLVVAVSSNASVSLEYE